MDHNYLSTVYIAIFINLLVTNDCSGDVSYLFTLLPITREHLSILFSYSEANASELLDNIEKLFSLYYIHCDILSTI